MPIGVNNFLTVLYSNESSTAGADGTRGVGRVRTDGNERL